MTRPGDGFNIVLPFFAKSLSFVETFFNFLMLMRLIGVLCDKDAFEMLLSSHGLSQRC